MQPICKDTRGLPDRAVAFAGGRCVQAHSRVVSLDSVTAVCGLAELKFLERGKQPIMYFMNLTLDQIQIFLNVKFQLTYNIAGLPRM
jgi:hypothetical protein